MAGKSSPPLSQPGRCARRFKRPVHFNVGSRWPQALVQTRERLRLRSFALATWPSCRGPRQPTASELAVVPSTTPSALNSNAWPARPRRVLSRHNVGSKFLRAFYCVPSHADERAQHTRHASRGSGGAALTLETSAVFQTGPRRHRKRPDLPSQAPRQISRHPKSLILRAGLQRTA